MKDERGNVHHRLFRNLLDSEYNIKLFVLNNTPNYLAKTLNVCIQSVIL